MKKTISAALTMSTALAMCFSSEAGTIFTESFEGDPGTGYTLTTAFDDGSFDFFDRYAVPDNANAARDDFQNGWDGQYGILSQDNDGDGGPATVTIDIAGIDITAKTGLATTILFGGLNSEPNFNNYEAAEGDGIEIYADIDGSGPVLIGAFKPNATGTSDLYLDSDLNGVGDGAALTIDLAPFTFLIPGGGSSLDLSIALTSTDSFEPLAVDNVVVLDNVPEPTTGLMLALAVVTFLSGRRCES